MRKLAAPAGSDNPGVRGDKGAPWDASASSSFGDFVVRQPRPALAHSIGDAAEQAYRRGDALEKRRRLMADWATFCG